VFGHQQRGSFVGLQRNLLRQHAVAGDEIVFRHKTPAGQLAAGRVQLEDIDADAMTYPISLSAVAAGDVEIPVRVMLRQVFSRKPLLQ
jgi:hypothetical protein